MSPRTLSPRAEDPAAAARAAVGWYGDPTISWSVLLQVTLAAPVSADAVAQRLADLVIEYPHLGAPPTVLAVDGSCWPAVCASFADEPYADGAPLLRAAVDAGSSPTANGTNRGRLLVAAHHGATDGLGLLAVLAAALGADLVSQARGIADRPPSSVFLASATRRLVEALIRPPARITPSVYGADKDRSGEATARRHRVGGRPAADGGADLGSGNPGTRVSAPGTACGDILVCAELPAPGAQSAGCAGTAGPAGTVGAAGMAGMAGAVGAVGAAALTAATHRAAQEWNARHRAPYRRAVAGLGASRRDGNRATPVADSAFLRLRLPRSADAEAVRGLIAAQPPEPNFPRSRSAVPAVLTRLLASRLGSTFLASNLGIVDGPAEVRSLAFYPAASGRSGIAVGAATIDRVTTVTLRARRISFDHTSAATLLSMIVAHLGAPASTAISPLLGL